MAKIMEVKERNIHLRMHLVTGAILLVVAMVVIKLVNIQFVEGDYYRELAKQRTVKTFTIPANKGNIYSADGSLLATSIPNYTIRFDAMAPKKEDFDKYVSPLADSLSVLLGKPASFYRAGLQKARSTKNRYYLLARNLSYTEYIRMKGFPLFNLGTYKGGMIVDQKTVREHPIGRVAELTIGYERNRPDGKPYGKGIEWAYRKYLNGKDGRVLKQKIAKNQWKPIRDQNEIDPLDGYDVISTIDVYIQDIAHHALLKQLVEYNANHGCVIVMETATGKIRAISNLGKSPSKDSLYTERDNYAIREVHEPGSTFKLVGLMALLEEGKVDTTDIYDTNGGVDVYRGAHVRDSKKGGYGKISLARGMELSSNTVIVKAVYNEFKNRPKDFLNYVDKWNLGKPLGLPFEGEGKPKVPRPGQQNWSAIALPWMAFGYGIEITPLQTLTLYNAVANNGVMVRPQFVSEIREWNRTIKQFEPEVINPKICSDATLKKVQTILENVVKRGTGKKLYNPNFTMAGKTGTAQANYNRADVQKHYISSFVGYFPADQPKYTCIVVVHEPNTSGNNYYGADVAGPVFKRIAQKIFTDAPATNEVKNINANNRVQDSVYTAYYNVIQQTEPDQMPDVTGLPGMDAIALLNNMQLQVQLRGTGKVKKQSIPAKTAVKAGTTVVLELQ